jgi:hypothetical protein
MGIYDVFHQNGQRSLWGHHPLVQSSVPDIDTLTSGCAVLVRGLVDCGPYRSVLLVTRWCHGTFPGL